MSFKQKKYDWTLFFLFFILLIFGITSVYSVSVIKVGEELIIKGYFLKQLLWIGISLALLTIFLFIPLSNFTDYALIYYYLSICLMIAVLFLPEINGSNRWIKIFGFQFQPSELMKFTYVLMMGKYLTKNDLKESTVLFRAFLISIPVWILLLLEPDLGSTLTFVVVFFTILIFTCVNINSILLLISPILAILFYFNIYFFLILLFLFLLFFIRNGLGWVKITFMLIINTFFTINLSIIWNLLKPYQQTRIQTFINPLLDPLGSGYQIIQSKISIGSGGLTGKGFMESTQKNFSFLPEFHTDYIFSIISEEWGFFGNVIFLSVWFLFFYRIIYITKVNKLSSAKRIINIGLFGFIFFPFILNIMMSLGLLPSTGIPLPLTSYGGSNILITSLSIAYISIITNE